jgi:hypothetical protein
MQTTVLKDLTTPDMAQLGLLYEVIADIRRLDRPGTNDEAFRSGVRQHLAERLAMFTEPLDWPPARLEPGDTAADAAGMISGLLMWHDGPATPVFAQLAQAPVTITVTRATHRGLTPGEATTLEAESGTRAYEREGNMTAGEVLVARIRLILIPGRIPGVAWGAIQAGQPAGEALEPYKMRRDRRKVSLSRAAATVDASARMLIGVPVGMAEEHVSERFCRHVALLAR